MNYFCVTKSGVGNVLVSGLVLRLVSEASCHRRQGVCTSNCSCTHNPQLSMCCTRILRIHASSRVGLGLIQHTVIGFNRVVKFEL